MTTNNLTPVHATEMEAFLSCRLRWFWSAPKPRGMYLESVQPADALAFGLAMHHGLQHYYDKTDDPVTAFIDKLKSAVGGYQWGFLTGELSAEMIEMIELGTTMVEGYIPYARRKDSGWHILATETEWSTELAPGVPVAGRFDLVIEDASGLIWPLDFKTTSSTSPSWAEDSVQGAMYVSAARRLYGTSVGGIIFRFLRKKMPETWDKLILRNGTLTEKKSLDSATTYAEYLRAIAVVAVCQVWGCNTARAHELLTSDLASWHGSEKWQEFDTSYHAGQIIHRENLQKLMDAETFYWDVIVPMDTQRVERNERLLLLPTARTMHSKPFVAPTGLGSAWALCRRCEFRLACQALRNDPDPNRFREILRSEFKERGDFDTEGTDDD